MKRKTFVILLAVTVAVCLLLTLAHLAYVAWAYQRSSVIEFIAKELW